MSITMRRNPWLTVWLEEMKRYSLPPLGGDFMLDHLLAEARHGS